MSLKSIHMKNYKSIPDIRIDLKDMNLFLGENGSGKTNILSALQYFYDNMISQNPSYQVFDQNNPLNDQMEITLTYNMNKLLMRSRRNRKEKKKKYLAYYKAMEKIAKEGQVSLTLRQVKGGAITWDQPIQTRKLLYHLYPLYHVDAREINLVDWEELWTDIGDLIKPDSDTSEALQESIVDQVRKTEGSLSQRLGHVEGMLQRLQVSPCKYSVREFAAHMAQIYYNGDVFSYQGHGLNSLSNGTNSFNYISLLVSILSAIGRFKMKEPVLLMDEPEISLHFHMIDELSDVLMEGAEDIVILAATHAPRLVRNIFVKEQGDCTIYQVYRRGAYSDICLLKMFADTEKREKYFLTEHHANAFFAKLLILVEGETELELLQNSYLRQLFPVLKQAEIIKGMSNRVIYRIVDTDTRHYYVPTAALLDMDKILRWDLKKNHMEWLPGYQYVFEQERYVYGRERCESVNRRRRIQAMCDKCYFSKRLPFYGSDDENYQEFIQLVKDYYAGYHIYPASTTIEGTLINRSSYHKIIRYLRQSGRWNGLEPAYRLLYHETDQVNFLRLLFHGKSDLLLKANTVIENNPRMYPEIKSALEKHAIAKTAWVSDWLQYYFADLLGLPAEKLTQRQFALVCEDAGKKKKIRKSVHEDFPELYQFLRAVNQLYLNRR